MCQHVLCLSLKGPPLFFLEHINSVPAHSSSIFIYFLGSVKLRHQAKLVLYCLIQDLFLRMRNPRSLKQEFLRKWLMSLGKCASSKKTMSVLERKKVIKLSADLAMASTRNESTRWSQALIFNASRDEDNKTLAKQILGSTECQRLRKADTCSAPVLCNSNRKIRSRKILKRSRKVQRVKKRVVEADSIAKRLVQKRTRTLKSLVPGGEFMDDVSLIEETLDYMQSLRAQVEVMRCLLTASCKLINL